MRTTLELPDALLRQLKAKAALEGTTLKALMRSFVEQGCARLLSNRQRLPQPPLPCRPSGLAGH